MVFEASKTFWKMHYSWYNLSGPPAFGYDCMIYIIILVAQLEEELPVPLLGYERACAYQRRSRSAWSPLKHLFKCIPRLYGYSHAGKELCIALTICNLTFGYNKVYHRRVDHRNTPY